MNQVVDFINVNRDRYVEELKEYLAIPSISALPQHAGDVRRCAEWTGDALRTVGMANCQRALVSMMAIIPQTPPSVQKAAVTRGKHEDPR